MFSVVPLARRHYTIRGVFSLQNSHFVHLFIKCSYIPIHSQMFFTFDDVSSSSSVWCDVWKLNIKMWKANKHVLKDNYSISVWGVKIQLLVTIQRLWTFPFVESKNKRYPYEQDRIQGRNREGMKQLRNILLSTKFNK